LLKEAILLTNTRFALHEADGLESATAYFHAYWREDQLRRYPRPELVLLDYHLGDRTGVEFLYWLRVLKKISSIPVVIFSGAEGEGPVTECYSKGANYFLRKPKTIAGLMTIVRALYSSLTSAQQPNPILSLPEYEPNNPSVSKPGETRPPGTSDKGPAPSAPDVEPARNKSTKDDTIGEKPGPK
jgi:CheY-like chemotaxis protein